MANVWEAIKKHEAEKAQQNRGETLAVEIPHGRSAPASGASATPAASVAPAAPAVSTARAEIDPAAHRLGTNGSFSELMVAHHDRGGMITEEFRALRTNLLAQSPDERFCYLVTSANAGEGKTVTAANLAVVMAERLDRRTVLIDADLRKHKLASMLAARNAPGMVDLLQGKATLREALQPTTYPNLFFIPSGTIKLAEVGEVMGRPELDELVAELRRQYDYVLFDTPPINVVSDAGMLGGATGEALLVVRMNKTHRESVDKAIRLLRAANVKLGGLVLTHRKFLIPNYLYRYS